VLKKVAKEDKQWREYFARIKQVCPWSYKLMDKILIVETHENCLNTWGSLFNSSKYEAFVYTYADATVDWLKKKCDQLNQTHQTSEWLWSHPQADSGDGNSTHIPCLIQQDKAKLTDLRTKMDYAYE
jgi:hypothetical protein